MKHLVSKPARNDLTDRECSKLLGSLIGGLCQMSDVETVRDAIRWIADSEEFWSSVKFYSNPKSSTGGASGTNK